MNKRVIKAALRLMPLTLPIFMMDSAAHAQDTAKGYIVVFKDNVAASDPVAEELSKKHAVQKEHVYSHAIKGFSMRALPAIAKRMKNDPRIAFIEEDKVFTTNAQTTPAGITRTGATKNATAAISGDGQDMNVDIAIIDTGVSLSHPDLNVYRNVSFVKGAKTGDDDNGHGTHVAGTAAAKDNQTGVVGVAPGARIWALKVLAKNGSGTTSNIVKAIDYVTANAAQIDVVNMSLGGPGADDGNCGRTNGDSMHKAICASVAKGVVYVVAAGNENKNAASSVPAAYDEVITVSATVDTDGLPGGLGAGTNYGADDSRASFSNYGSEIDIAAPGTQILSLSRTGGTTVMSGTSMASPHVAGAAALYILNNGKPTSMTGATLVRDALVSLGFPQSSADGFDGDMDGYQEPLLNVEAIDPVL